LHVCLDEHLYALQAQAGAFDPAAWREARRRALADADAGLALPPPPAVGGSGGRRRLVIFDDTNGYASLRLELLRLARSRAAAFLVLHVAAPPHVAAARNAGRSGLARVPEDVLARAAAPFEPPEAGRGGRWEAAATLVLDGGGPPPDAGELWPRLEARWGPPPPSEESLAAAAAEEEARVAGERVATAASAAHQLDLWSRRLLSEAVAAAPAAERAAAAGRLNAARRALLAAARGAGGDGEEARRRFASLCSGCGRGGRPPDGDAG
jgi:O-phosphoseryl-tRNA(Sec) kinase